MLHSDPDQAITGSNDASAAFVTRTSTPSFVPAEEKRVK
jgi:hypothetical protein